MVQRGTAGKPGSFKRFVSSVKATVKSTFTSQSNKATYNLNTGVASPGISKPSPSPTPSPSPSGGGSSGGSSGGGSGGGSSGGGSGGGTFVGPTPASSGSTTPTSPSTQEIAKDIPSSYKSYEPPKIRNIPNYVRTNIRYDPIETIKGTGGIVLGATKSRAKSVWDKLTSKEKRDLAIEREKQMLQTGRRITPSGDGQGTDIISQNPYTQEEVVKSAKDFGVSTEATQDFLTNRAIEKVNTQKNFDLKVPVAEISSQAQIEYSNIYNALASQVSAGVITVDKANELLKKQADELNLKTERKIKDLEKNWNDTTGKKIIAEEEKNINKQLDKVAISKGIQSALITGAVVGAGATVIAGTSALAGKAVQTAGTVALGVGTVKTGKYFVENVGTGTLTPSRIGAILIPQAAFLVGAGVGSYGVSRFGGSGKIDQVKLNEALKTATVEIKDVKAITNQNQLRLYKIPENLQLGKLEYGRSVRIIEYNLKGSTPEQTALIKKSFPDLKIKSYEVADVKGNTINRKYILEKNIAGKKSLIDYETGQSVGEYKPELKATVMETVSLDVSKGKRGGFTEARKTFEVSPEPKTKIILENGELKRVSISDTFKFEGKKLTASKGGVLTFKDLQEVVKAENLKRFPSSKSTALEIQDLTGIKVDTASVTKKAGELEFGFGLENIGLDLKTSTLKVKSKNVQKPIEFKVDKKSKPFDFADNIKDVIKSQEVKVEKRRSKNKKIQELSLTEKTDLLTKNKQQVPSYDFSESIVKSVKRATKSRSKSIQTPNNIYGISSMYGTKNLNKFNQLDRVSPIQSIGNLTGINFSSIPKQSNIQNNKLGNNIKNYFLPNINFGYSGFIPTPTPKINFKVFPPMLPSSNLGGGKISKAKKQKKKNVNLLGKYSASLFNAAFDSKPIDVTLEEYKKLSRKTYTGLEGSRPLLNIVPDKDTKKIKKELKKVKF